MARGERGAGSVGLLLEAPQVSTEQQLSPWMLLHACTCRACCACCPCPPSRAPAAAQQRRCLLLHLTDHVVWHSLPRLSCLHAVPAVPTAALQRRCCSTWRLCTLGPHPPTHPCLPGRPRCRTQTCRTTPSCPTPQTRSAAAARRARPTKTCAALCCCRRLGRLLGSFCCVYSVAPCRGNTARTAPDRLPCPPSSLPSLPAVPALSGSGSNDTFALVNGGWQPVLGMVAAKWQRWRMLHAGISRFFDMQAREKAELESQGM